LVRFSTPEDNCGFAQDAQALVNQFAIAPSNPKDRRNPLSGVCEKLRERKNDELRIDL
jgi:hypothetical protein